MRSRDQILAKIRRSKPEPMELPEVDLNLFKDRSDKEEFFKKTLEAVGGKILTPGKTDIHEVALEMFPESRMRYSVLNGAGSFNTLKLDAIQRPHDLEKLDVLILKGKFGVAENGAIWLQDDEIPVRVLPFITKQLIITLDSKEIVSNLHEAYIRLEKTDFDFGLFLSGPSKTADIEQSLVIGAQGALSLWVVLE